MNDYLDKAPPLPQIESSVPMAPEEYLDRTNQLGTPTIRLQASKQALKAADQNHHAPLSPQSPYIYAENGLICIENQGKLPTTKCIFTNDFAEKVIRLALRDAKNPSTWWGKRPRLRVGITQSELRKLRKRSLATWSAVTFSASLLTFATWGTLNGIPPSLTFASYGIGSVLILISGYFRANIRISASVVGKAFTVVKGAHPEYLEQFDQYENRKLIEEGHLSVSAQIEQFFGVSRFSSPKTNRSRR